LLPPDSDSGEENYSDDQDQEQNEDGQEEEDAYTTDQHAVSSSRPSES